MYTKNPAPNPSNFPANNNNLVNFIYIKILLIAFISLIEQWLEDFLSKKISNFKACDCITKLTLCSSNSSVEKYLMRIDNNSNDYSDVGSCTSSSRFRSFFGTNSHQ